MEDKKMELFNRGKELFSAKGFKDTNVADITKMAGVSVGTFYNYTQGWKATHILARSVRSLMLSIRHVVNTVLLRAIAQELVRCCAEQSDDRLDRSRECPRLYAYDYQANSPAP